MMERLKERRKVIDILEKMNFFQGQRAGRELWNDKPFEVQEEDLENFNRDIRTIRDYIWDVEKELKSYKDLEEQGLLLKLPCKVGDTVYLVFGEGRICDGICKAFQIDEKNKMMWVEGESFAFHVSFKRFGKTVFLTKEEAEAKLKELENE